MTADDMLLTEPTPTDTTKETTMPMTDTERAIWRRIHPPTGAEPPYRSVHLIPGTEHADAVAEALRWFADVIERGMGLDADLVAKHDLVRDVLARLDTATDTKEPHR